MKNKNLEFSQVLGELLLSIKNLSFKAAVEITQKSYMVDHENSKSLTIYKK